MGSKICCTVKTKKKSSNVVNIVEKKPISSNPDKDHAVTGVFYFKNGNVEEKGVLDGDMKQGYWTRYYESGILQEEGSYTDNKKTGEWVSYWSNGEIRSKGNYDEDHIQTGEWFYHREDGTVRDVKIFGEDEQ